MEISDLDVFVFIVLVQLGVVCCGEVLECWGHCEGCDCDDGVLRGGN